MTKALSETKFKKVREMCVSPRNEKGYDVAIDRRDGDALLAIDVG